MTPGTPIDLLAKRRNRLLNTVHTWLLAAGSLALLAVTAWAFGDTVGIVYAVIFGAVSMWAVRRISPAMILSMYKAREITAAEFPMGFEIVRELARRAGLLATPKLYVVPSRMMNAFAVGRRDNAAIAITDALASRLTARELAGVLAHEISHIAHDDVKVMALSDMVARFTSFMSTVGLLSLVLNLFGFFGGFEAQVPWFAVLILLSAPTVGGLLQLALSRTREFDADLGAALLTGDPDGLATALTKLERVQGRLWEGLVLPGGRIPDPSMLRSHPRTADRVARLMALKTGDGGLPPMPPDPPKRRPSLVPRVGPRDGHYLPGTSGVSALLEDDSLPATTDSLYPPDGGPRIRVTRGGVWW